MRRASGSLAITAGWPCVALAAAAAAAPPPLDAPSLEPGAAASRSFAPGEVHRYRIACAAGDSVRFAVEQHGVDLVSTVTSPAGAEILELDGPTGPYGAEAGVFVAEAGGEHVLAVRAVDPAAAGVHAVRLVERRPATPRDRAGFEAARLVGQGARLRRARSAEGLRRALDAFEGAARQLEAQGDAAGEAAARCWAARAATEQGDLQRAAEAYRRTLALAEEESALAAVAHTGLGEVLNDGGQPEQALEHLEQALPLARRLGDRHTEAAALNHTAVARYRLGASAEALLLLEQALAIARSGGLRALEAGATFNVASIHELRGEKQQALDAYQRAVELSRRSGEPRGLAATLVEVGRVYAVWGDYARALDVFEQTLALARGAGEQQLEALTLGHIGRVHLYQGDLARARLRLAASVELSRRIGARGVESSALSSLGEVHAREGDRAGALERLRAALALQRGLGVGYWMVRTLTRLGRTLLLPGPAGERSADLAAAREALEEARRIAAGLGADEQEAAALHGLARVALAAADPRAALAHADAAVATVESQRAQISQEELRSSYFAAVHPYYQTEIEALMALAAQEPGRGHEARALHVSERARARHVLEGLAASALDVRAGADPALVARERELRRELSALAAQQGRSGPRGAPPEARARAERTLRALSAERQQVLAKLRESSPRYAALVQPAILDAEAIQRELLDPGTALVQYALGEHHSYVWVVTADAVAARELPPGPQLEALVRRLYEELTVRARQLRSAARLEARAARADRRAAALAAELSRRILPPGLDAPGVERLVIVADGALHLVPFAALPLPGDAAAAGPRLAARFEIVQAPSASWVHALRRLPSVGAPRKTLAVLADPVFDAADSRVRGAGTGPGRPGAAAAPAVRLRRGTAEGALPRLPFSRREARALAALVPAGQASIALDFEASRERALRPELSDYRIVHFATHSLVDHEHPDLSGVVLSLVDRRGRHRDGFLRLQDVYGMRLPAEMVVLSACQTALGKQVAGEGLLGLSRGFMYAGARRVVASLWPVDEVATARLMEAFYRGVLAERRSAADALRRAQRVVRSRPGWRAPYFWAGFVIQGDWR